VVLSGVTKGDQHSQTEESLGCSVNIVPKLEEPVPFELTTAPVEPPTEDPSA